VRVFLSFSLFLFPPLDDVTDDVRARGTKKEREGQEGEKKRKPMKCFKAKEVYRHEASGAEIEGPDGWFLVEESEESVTFSPSVRPSETCARLGLLI
jgi:hypothetical protein